MQGQRKSSHYPSLHKETGAESRAQVHNRGKRKANSGSSDCHCEELLTSLQLKCGDSHFLLRDNVFFFSEFLALCASDRGLLRTEALYFVKSKVHWCWTLWQQISVLSEQQWLLVFLKARIDTKQSLDFFFKVIKKQNKTKNLQNNPQQNTRSRRNNLQNTATSLHVSVL